MSRLFSRRKLLVAAAIFTAFGGAVAGVVVKVQSMIAFPYIPPSAQIPGAVQAVNGEVLWLDVDGKRVEAWFLPAHRPGAAPLIMNTHGNGELIDQWAERVGPLREAGFGVLLVEYLALGLLAALTGVLLATVAAWALSVFVFKASFAVPLAPLVIALLAVPALTVVTGLMMSRSVLNHPPLAILRAEA